MYIYTLQPPPPPFCKACYRQVSVQCLNSTQNRDVASGIGREQKLISNSRCRVIESSSLVSILFREVFRNPYISIFHLLINVVFLFYICVYDPKIV